MWSESPKKALTSVFVAGGVSVPVCARAAVFFVSACVQSILMCGCLHVPSLLSAVRLSLETIHNIFGKLFLRTKPG